MLSSYVTLKVPFVRLKKQLAYRQYNVQKGQINANVSWKLPTTLLREQTSELLHPARCLAYGVHFTFWGWEWARNLKLCGRCSCLEKDLMKIQGLPKTRWRSAWHIIALSLPLLCACPQLFKIIRTETWHGYKWSPAGQLFVSGSSLKQHVCSQWFFPLEISLDWVSPHLPF